MVEKDQSLVSNVFRFDDGAQEYARVFPKYLQKVSLEVISRKECKGRYGDVIHKSHICVYAPGKGACFKDSGGPLMVGKFQIGIFSGGKRCGAFPGYPGLYTNIAIFRDWIDKKMRSLSGSRRDMKVITTKNGNITRIVERWRAEVDYNSMQLPPSHLIFRKGRATAVKCPVWEQSPRRLMVFRSQTVPQKPWISVEH
ncbi:hypothetical protein QAD02_004215 [Eretmocerus hayati]|uniref:Uncharacterized protein n=1 Tax=Eretmocerus hayati TaxID=131215 RepID=A0ACC2NNW7_9HYME|nr:hypothetical protein QAD02_004215 [Eretmocerus hayati]